MKAWKWIKCIIGWLCAIINGHKTTDVNDLLNDKK